MALTYGFLIPDEYTNSQQFSEAVRALVGDGICKQGGKYALTLAGGFKTDLSSGYAVTNGRFAKHDEPFTLSFPPSGNNADRYDAIAARADYGERKAEITVLVDIDPQNPIRNEAEYNAVLYVLRIRRGATVFTAEDVQDTRADLALCGYITPLSDIAGNVLYIYEFLESGIDKAVARLLALSQALVDKAEKEIGILDAAIAAVSGTSIGDMETSRVPLPPPNAWLLCDGGAVPVQYPALSGLLNGKLPDISRMGDRYKTYIYGGVPVEV